MEWFKDGKALPKRHVWEIALGAYNHFIQEESLVDVPIEEGMNCDVIGDVHGKLKGTMFWLGTLTGHVRTIL